MDLKSVMVAMDASETAVAGARGAAVLATTHGAHLIAMSSTDSGHLSPAAVYRRLLRFCGPYWRGSRPLYMAFLPL